MHGKIRLLNFFPFYDGGLFQLHPKKDLSRIRGFWTIPRNCIPILSSGTGHIRDRLGQWPLMIRSGRDFCLINSSPCNLLWHRLRKGANAIFLISPSKELDSFQKNMKNPSLQESDGIGECPMTCENFFKLPRCEHLSLDLRWNRDPAFPWNRIIGCTTA